MGKVIVCQLDVIISTEDWRNAFYECAAQIKSGILLLPSCAHYVATAEADRVDLRERREDE